MKHHNLKVWLRLMRQKWVTNNTSTTKSKSVANKEEDISIYEFDHNPLHGIDQRLRDQQ